MKSLKCRKCVYPGVMSKRPFGFQCPSCLNTVDLDCLDIDLETYRLQEFKPQILICDGDSSRLRGIDLAKAEEQTVVLVGTGHTGVNTAAVISSLRQLGYSVVQATEAVEAFNVALALVPEHGHLFGEELKSLALRPCSEPFGPYNPTLKDDGWYRKFENKRRWRK